jgi:DNA-directed RNA polymerase II subunit RPB7
MKFDSSGENCYVSEDQQIRIQRDCEVRVRIVGMRIDANDIFCIATIKDDYLGLIGFSSAQDGMDL